MVPVAGLLLSASLGGLADELVCLPYRDGWSACIGMSAPCELVSYVPDSWLGPSYGS